MTTGPPTITIRVLFTGRQGCSISAVTETCLLFWRVDFCSSLLLHIQVVEKLTTWDYHYNPILLLFLPYSQFVYQSQIIQFNSQIILIPPSLIENPLREGAHSSLLIWESIKICTQSETGGILIWP